MKYFLYLIGSKTPVLQKTHLLGALFKITGDQAFKTFVPSFVGFGKPGIIGDIEMMSNHIFRDAAGD
jgi:hypothetical protein